MMGFRMLASMAVAAVLAFQPLAAFAGNNETNSANTETITAPGMEVEHDNIFWLNPCSDLTSFVCDECNDNAWDPSPQQDTATYAAVHYADDDDRDCDVAVLFFDHYGNLVCRLNHNIQGGETWHVATQDLDPSIRKIHDYCDDVNWAKGRVSLYSQATTRCKDFLRVHFEVIKYGPLPMMMKHEGQKCPVQAQPCTPGASAEDDAYVGYCQCKNDVCRYKVPMVSHASNKLEESRVNNNQHDDKQE